MTEPTLKLRNRIYHPVPIDDVQAGDAVVYVDAGRRHTRFATSVTKTNVVVDQPKGFKPKTKRVHRSDIKEVWRWHKRTK
jgi:hypothetical protein